MTDIYISPRQEQVLLGLAEGTTNIAMAAQLGVSESTVAAHIRDLRKKFCARNRSHLVYLAYTEGRLYLKGGTYHVS